MAAAGAGLRIVVAPTARAARNAAAVTACGISCWPTTTAGRWSTTTRWARSDDTWSFAPGTTRIRLWPASSTQMGATPDGPGTRVTWSVLMPSRSKLASVAVPWSSSPTAATMTTCAPKRAAATAWLAPLPPKPTW